MFVNREEELAMLERHWNSPTGEFIVLYGRRRVGKSRLLAEFADRGHPGLIFEATSGTTADNLDDISRLIAAHTGRPSHAEQPFTSWRAVFAALTEIVETSKTMIVLDEFQFVARESRELGSLINRLVDRYQDDDRLFLVVSGSDASFFADEVMGYGATTYGRRTGALRLQPFTFEHSRHLMPAFSAEDQVRAYSVFGGMPYYLSGLPHSGSLEEAILTQVLVPGAKLREEPIFLFAQESKIRDADTYRSVVRAIANGATTPNEVAQRVGVERRNLDHYLVQLEEMGLIAKRRPVAKRHAASRFSLAVRDPFLRFWFRLVGPFESRLIEESRAWRHLEETVMPEIDETVAPQAFEEICREWVTRAYPKVAEVGSWWGSVKERTPEGVRNVRREVDVVGVDPDGVPLALGSCKWTRAPHPHEELVKLKRVRELLECPDADLLVFSRSDVDDRIAEEAATDPSIRIVGMRELCP